MGVMSEIQLKRLSEHKYSAQCTSLLDPLFQIWWRWLVEQMPLWLAPNLLTVMGFLANLIPNFILIYYCPQAFGNVSIILFALNDCYLHTISSYVWLRSIDDFVVLYL